MKGGSTVVILALWLTGCASVPDATAPKPQVKQSYTKPAKIVQPAKPEASTPTQQIKQRWRYFAIPKWLQK